MFDTAVPFDAYVIAPAAESVGDPDGLSTAFVVELLRHPSGIWLTYTPATYHVTGAASVPGVPVRYQCPIVDAPGPNLIYAAYVRQSPAPSRSVVSIPYEPPVPGSFPAMLSLYPFGIHALIVISTSFMPDAGIAAGWQLK